MGSSPSNFDNNLPRVSTGLFLPHQPVTKIERLAIYLPAEPLNDKRQPRSDAGDAKS